jgi:hypothetical protein
MDEKVKIRFPTNKSCELARRAVDAILNVYFEFERPGARKVTARTITSCFQGNLSGRRQMFGM